jgi:CrcB protein
MSLQTLASCFWIGLGSAIGGVGRYLLSGFVAHRVGEIFPAGTVVVNVSGSFLIGFIAALSAPDGRIFLEPMTRQFLMMGVLGGYTTFSSFSLQTLSLAGDGEWFYAMMNIALSVVLCLVAVWLGQILAQTIAR